MEKIRFRGLERETVPLGVGTWQWGDRTFWQYGKRFQREDVIGAFDASVRAGITLFDTAEIYGKGESERILGECVRKTDGKALVASKYMPFPNRIGRRAVRRAASASLERLGVRRIDLYQVHMPFPFPRRVVLMDELAELVRNGSVAAIGVSNFGAAGMLRARDLLARKAVPLAANQVNYSLLRRKPERDGTLKACHDSGIVLIAYSPLAQGLLSGKYHDGEKVEDFRRYRRPFFGSQIGRSLQVVRTLREIAAGHGATPGQVAIRWLIQKGNVVPIPGAKNRSQAEENAGALKFSLTSVEMEQLDQVSRPWL